MQVDLFQDFTKKNMIIWLAELWSFLTRPRLFVRKAAAKAPEELLSQYLFYFIIYTASYLLTTNGVEFNAAIKPTFFNIIFCIPIALLFGLISKIVTRRFRLKEIFLFVFTLQIVFGSLEITLYSVYLTSESQVYLILYSMLNFVLLTYLFYGIGFVIQERFWKGVLIVVTSFFLLSGIYIGIDQIALRNNMTKLETYENDVVFGEYYELMSSIAYGASIPIQTDVYHEETKIKEYFGIQDIANSSELILSADSIKRFKRTVKSNITILKSRVDKLKFQRNIGFAQTLLNYEMKLDLLLDSNFLRSNLDIQDYDMLNNRVAGEKFLQRLDFKGNLIGTSSYIQMYNNQIIKLHRVNENITLLSRASVFLGGVLIDGWFLPDRKVFKKEPFYNLSDE